MAILNWAAPATQSDKAQEAQGTVFAQLVGQTPQNIGLVLCPVFHYKRNQMFFLEHCMVKGLASRGVDVDCQASLLLKDKTDVRDARPLVYPLRIVRPLTACIVEDEDDSAKVDKKAGPGRFWFTAPLMRNRRTSEAEQVPSKKLRVVEDLTEHALPASAQLDGGLRGAKKFEQIGPYAALKLLEGLLDAEVPAEVGGVVLLDLNCGVGDFFGRGWRGRGHSAFFGWICRCKATAYPLLYMGATADGTACEWLRHVQSDEVLHNLASGALTLPGFQQKSHEHQTSSRRRQRCRISTCVWCKGGQLSCLLRRPSSGLPMPILGLSSRSLWPNLWLNLGSPLWKLSSRRASGAQRMKVEMPRRKPRHYPVWTSRL